MFNDLITKYGTLTGLALVAVFLGAYFMDPLLMLGQGLYWSSMVLTLGGMSWACVEDRKLKGSEDYPFKDALRVAFGVFALSSLIYHVFDLTMFVVVNPDLAEMQLTATLESIEKLTPYFGEEWAEQTTKMLEDNPPVPSMSSSFFDYTFGLIGGFFWAAIISLIVKR
jgi:hypothetical protein